MAKKIKICALCGDTNVFGGRDHLPPKAVFTKPRPQDTITVPVCFKCNNNGSKNDETFKTFLAFILGNSLKTESLFKSAISTAKKKFTKYILLNSQRTCLSTPSGIIFESSYNVHLKPEIIVPFELVTKRITTGLFYHHFGKFIGINTYFEVNFHPVLKEEMLGQVAYFRNKIGSGEFTYLYAKAEEGTKCISVWIFEFYERYWISCITFSKDHSSLISSG